MRVERITSRQNERVKRVAALREARARRATGLFVAEGVREVERAVAAGLVAREVWVCPEVLGEGSAKPQAAGREAAWFEVSRAVLEKLAYRENPEGILGVFEAPRWRLGDVRARAMPELWLVAAGLTKPGNLGAMARTASAAGAAAMIVTPTTSGGAGGVDAFNPNAIRASTGAVFTLPILEVAVAEALAFFRERQVAVFAADPAGERAHDEVDLRGPAAIVIGAEDAGLEAAWTQAPGATRVAIRTFAGLVDSLNASVAAAVLLFEAARQRRHAGARSQPNP